LARTNTVKCVSRPYFIGSRVDNKIEIYNNFIQTKEKMLVTSSSSNNERKLFSKLIMLSQELKKPDHSLEEFSKGIGLIN
jgi:hypothetical protein